MIGVVVPNLVTHYYAAVLDGIEAEARRSGYSVISANSHESFEDEAMAVDNFLGQGAEFSDLTILRIELGKRFVPDYEIVVLANFFQISTDELLNIDDIL